MNDLPGELVYRDATSFSPQDGSLSDPVAKECYENIGHIIDCFHIVHGRNSINGNGLAVTASLHFGDSVPNAFWQGQQIVFGDGNRLFGHFTKSLDVIGHALTHGIVQFTAGLDYSGETGALNESLADVFGSLAKQWRNRQTFPEADWLIGEDCVCTDTTGVALRSLKAPGEAFSISDIASYWITRPPASDDGGLW
ncbi:hypothetical protein Hte_003528 [Hypoxylon texense]